MYVNVGVSTLSLSSIRFWNCSVLYLSCFETVRCYICLVLKLFGVIFVLFWNCSVLYLCCFEIVRCYICVVLKLFGVIFVLFGNCSVLYLCCFETVRCYICVVLKLFGVIFVLFWNCSVLYLSCFETVRCYICLVFFILFAHALLFNGQYHFIIKKHVGSVGYNVYRRSLWCTECTDHVMDETQMSALRL